MLLDYIHWVSGLSSPLATTEQGLYLPSEPPQDTEGIKHPSIGQNEVNGIALPESVIRQITEAGLNISWLSRAELQAATNSIVADGQVFDDPDSLAMGTDILDAIEKTQDEILADAGVLNSETFDSAPRIRPPGGNPSSYQERIAYERELAASHDETQQCSGIA